MNSEKFSGKVAVVTGGGSGIGKAICMRFAGEGAKVVILEVKPENGEATAKEIAQDGGEAKVYACDVGDHANAHAVMAQVASDFGRIDILVNNAGISSVGKLEDTSPEELDSVYRVNVKGVYNCLHAAIKPMVEQGGGVILNLASIASKLALADRFAYGMSKGAVLTMTFSVAKDYIDKNIRCNCVCPARVHTPFVDDYIAKNYPGKEEEMFQKLSEYQPIGRMAKPEEVANMAAFLCSDEAAFLTGCAYDVDGGVNYLR